MVTPVPLDQDTPKVTSEEKNVKVPSEKSKPIPVDVAEDRMVTPDQSMKDALKAPLVERNEKIPSEKSKAVPVDIKSNTVPANTSKDRMVTPVPAEDNVTHVQNNIQERKVTPDEPNYEEYERNMKITLRQPTLQPPKY